jgi:lipopolysaccharide export system protein LptA
MRMTSLITAALLAIAAAVPAAAQLAPNSGAPLDVEADELEVQNAQCISIWRGRAEALQDTSRLRADVLTARFEAKPGSGSAGASSNCGAIQTLEATGNVYYVTPQQRVRADRGLYEATRETITLTGDVIAVQGQNVLRGTRMVVNTRTGEGQVQGAATGRNKSGRVRGVFYPQQKQGQAAAQPR